MKRCETWSLTLREERRLRVARWQAELTLNDYTAVYLFITTAHGNWCRWAEENKWNSVRPGSRLAWAGNVARMPLLQSGSR
jgi:hypothetical protein